MKNSASTKTRCKPGDRARIISSRLAHNVGKVVAVVRPYHENEEIGGATWVIQRRPWVVVSLVGPLRYWQETTLEVLAESTLVLDDSQLQPLRDNEGGVEGIKVKTATKRRRAGMDTKAVQS